ncbi:MAG TPA: high-potential iron-sulfur protein [Steroidobacteraceae bacterium]|jgi:hypothetical protein|nr:high-potential iron-sulfur protein [Steroidobacteraceae bacterium]
MSSQRRTLIKNLAAAAGAAVIFPSRRALGGEAAHLDVKDPAAVALGYVENADQVDVKKHPTYTKGSNCDNCVQLQGKPGPSYRPCNLFPGKLVSAGGWCSGWTAEI